MYEKVVVRYNDGKIVKGWSESFRPVEGRLTILTANDPDRQELVTLKDAKAVFFVKSFSGEGDRSKKKGFDIRSCDPKTKVMIEFRDGERLYGCTSNDILPTIAGNFFVTPADLDSNNEKVFVLPGGLASVVHN